MHTGIPHSVIILHGVTFRLVQAGRNSGTAKNRKEYVRGSIFVCADLVVKFQPEMIYACYNSAVELQYVLPFLFGSAIREQVLHPESLRLIFEEIAEEFAHRRYGYELALKSDIYKIIVWIIRYMEQESSLPDAYTENTIRKIVAAFSYIEKHYAENITVRHVAEHCYVEYTYFSRTFKQIAKKSCTEDINHFRIQKAEALLLSTKLSITDISEKVGFDNVSYFIKQFRRYKGISPKQYQNRLLNRSRDNPP